MSIALCMVPLAGGAKLSRSKLAADFATWDDVMGEPVIEKRDGSLAFDHDGYFAVIGLMPAPIPRGDLEGPIATSYLWPESREQLAGMKGHLIVTVGQSGGDSGPIEVRKLLTQVTASVLATTEGALGVYWGDAGMLIGRDIFVDMAKSMLPHQTPFLLWVDFRVGPVDHDSGLSFGFTDGLEELGLMEMVTQNATDPPGDLRERLMSIADYLITNGPVIEDGHTVGEDANERITVVFGPSPFGHEGNVMRLDYSSKQKKKGWFGRG